MHGPTTGRTTGLAAAALTAVLLAAPSAPILARGGERKPAAGEEKETTKARRLAVGDEVKDLTLDRVGGGTWDVEKARDSVVVLVFGTPSSKESLDGLRALGKSDGAVSRSGAYALGVLRDINAKKAAEVSRDEKLSVSLAVDPKRKAYDRFARSGLPFTVVIDKKGKLVHAAAGFDDAAVAKVIKDLP